MVGEIDTSSIVTRLGFTADFSALDDAQNKLREFQQNAMSISSPLKGIAPGPLLPDISAELQPFKNLEDSLDTFKGSMQGSTQALVVADSEFNNLYGNLLNANEATKLTSTSMMRFGQHTLVTSTVTNQFGDVISSNTRLMETNIKKFQMWALSIMFFGMQINRIFGGMWKNMNTAYEKITGNTTALGQANLRLSASMTFLQVSIMTALEPAILPLIEGIIDLVNWFSQLPEPIKEVAGMFIIGGYFAGGLLQGIGSIMMFINFGLIPLIAQLTGAGGAQEAIRGFGLVTGQAGISMGHFGDYFLAAIPLIIMGILLLKGVFEQSTDYMAWNSKMNTAKMQGDWDLYNKYAIARAIEQRMLIPKILADMAYTIGDVFNQLVIMGSNFGIDFIEAIANAMSAIPGAETFFTPLIQALEKNRKDINLTFTKLGTDATAGYMKMLDDMNRETAKTMAEMGTPIKDIIEVYGQSNNVISDMFELARQGVINMDELNKVMLAHWQTVNGVTTNTEVYNNALGETKNIIGLVNQGINNNVNSLNSEAMAISIVTEKVNDLNNAWKVAGTAGVWTFKTGTSETDIQKMIGQIQSSNKVGDFIWRAGEGVTQISPNDTVIGTQNGNMGGGVSVGDINVSVTTGPINNDIDVKDLANKVSDEIMKDIRNYTKYVPTW